MATPKPNIILILTDEERCGGSFESPGVKDFRSTSLPNHKRIASEGVTFRQHRCSATACVPSRASIFTGLSPWQHGLFQTDGLAKLSDDPALVLLDAKEGPRTLGHLFEQLGYETAYVGKWHLSHVGPTGGLAPFGFGTKWVGPEPHGPDPENSGLQRDKGFVAQAEEFLDARRSAAAETQKQPNKPFLLVVSLVNPHDIVFWPAWWLPQAAVWAAVAGSTAVAHYAKRSRKLSTATFLVSLALAVPALKAVSLNLGSIPDPGPSPSEHDVPTASAHGSSSSSRGGKEEAPVVGAYRRAYHSAYGPAWFFSLVYKLRAPSYRRSYLKLLALADGHLGKLLDAADDLNHHGEHEQKKGGGEGGGEDRRRTVVVFTSDHGELLGAHGGLHQKWYNAFEETLRVPLVVRDPLQSSSGSLAGTDRHDLCSHLDLVPTLVGLAGGNDSDGSLPGRDLLNNTNTGVGKEEEEGGDALPIEGEETYFVTLDHVLEGRSRLGTAGRRFPWLGRAWPMRYAPLPLTQTAVEALVVRRRKRINKGAALASSGLAGGAARQQGGEGEQLLATTKAESRTSLWKVIRSFDPAGHAKSCQSCVTVEEDGKRRRSTAGDGLSASTPSSASPSTEELTEGHWCLFDLEHDPAERTNLAAASSPRAALTAGGESVEEVLTDMKRRLAFARRRHGGSFTAPESSEYSK